MAEPKTAEQSVKDSLQKALGRMSIADKDARRLLAEDPHKKHDFWDTQPVPKLGSQADSVGAIDTARTAADVQLEPYKLPTGFDWCLTDIDDPSILSEIYVLLADHYVEDDDNMFRFNYSREFLSWALKPPGFRREWHLGVRLTQSGKLMAFITGVPATVVVHGQELQIAEINFLCVHKKLRAKRLTPVLIKEITRRINLCNVFQAVYTSGTILPKPVARCRYYHRSLNPKKLIDVGFSSPAPRLTVNGTIKLYKLPQKPQLAGIRPLQPADVPSACRLLNSYLTRFEVHALFSEAEFAHQFLPQPDIVACYVIANPTGEVTDMCGFYSLPSTIVNHPVHKTLKAAYSYYNVATTVPLEALVKDALIFAKSMDYDVFNCLDIMDNESYLKELKFGKGDGTLQYYLFNWLCPDSIPSQVGLVLL